MTKDEALRMALEALQDPLAPTKRMKAITAIKEALAQPEKDIPRIGCVNHDCDKCKAQPEQDGQCKRCTDGCPACDARRLPEQEPVAWMNKTRTDAVFRAQDTSIPNWTDYYTIPLYTTPPQRTWVGLTDEELPPLVGDNGKYMELKQVRRFYKYVEAKLKEKNT